MVQQTASVCACVSVRKDGRGKWDRIRQDSPPRPNFLSCTDLVPTSQSGETLLALLRTHSWLPPRVSTISRIATAAPDSKFWDNSHLHSVLQLGDGGNSVRVINDLYSLNHYFISLNLVALSQVVQNWYYIVSLSLDHHSNSCSKKKAKDKKINNKTPFLVN